MSIQFGLELVNQQIISERQFVQLTRLKTLRQLPLGAVALRENLLTIHQVDEILDEQEVCNQRFGEIAIALRLLTESQVQQLLAAQLMTQPSICDLAVETGILTSIQAEILSRYILRSKVDFVQKRFAPRKPKFKKISKRVSVNTFVEH